MFLGLQNHLTEFSKIWMLLPNVNESCGSLQNVAEISTSRCGNVTQSFERSECMEFLRILQNAAKSVFKLQAGNFGADAYHFFLPPQEASAWLVDNNATTNQPSKAR